MRHCVLNEAFANIILCYNIFIFMNSSLKPVAHKYLLTVYVGHGSEGKENWQYEKQTNKTTTVFHTHLEKISMSLTTLPSRLHSQTPSPSSQADNFNQTIDVMPPNRTAEWLHLVMVNGFLFIYSSASSEVPSIQPYAQSDFGFSILPKHNLTY